MQHCVHSGAGGPQGQISKSIKCEIYWFIDVAIALLWRIHHINKHINNLLNWFIDVLHCVLHLGSVGPVNFFDKFDSFTFQSIFDFCRRVKTHRADMPARPKKHGLRAWNSSRREIRSQHGNRIKRANRIKRSFKKKLEGVKLELA